MAKMAWDDFVKANPECICVFINAAGVEIPSGTLTRASLKLPTPYGMLIEAFSRLLKGDWAIRKDKDVIHLIIKEPTDLTQLGKSFQVGPSGHMVSALCKQAVHFAYTPQVYANIAKVLGYVPAR